MEEGLFIALILLFCLFGLLHAGYCAFQTAKIDVPYGTQIFSVYEAIYNGAHSFLYEQYKYMAWFILGFSILILVTIGAGEGDLTWKDAIFCSLGFILGACTSILAGYIGMKIAVFANARTAITAQESLGWGFQTSYKAAMVMGTSLVSLGVFNLFILILIIREFYPEAHNDQKRTALLFEVIAGYGLGGSAIALFGRVAGGIFTKAADVGADLVGKLEYDIPEDSIKNPAVIADNVGDNVGDVAGMGSDLFGSLGEACCVVMVLASGAPSLHSSLAAVCLPLLIVLVGMFGSVLVSFLATRDGSVVFPEDVQMALKKQLVLSTALQTFLSLGVCAACLPEGPISFGDGTNFAGELFDGQTSMYKIWGAQASGLWAGLFIGWITEYYTSSAFKPVQDVANACKTGAATNIIYGLSLGYMSTIVPVACLAFTVVIAHALAGPYGIGMAATGVLSTMTTVLAVDVYGPICDNAGGIAEMTDMGVTVRERTDILDAAGNTTAAIGKGFAIGSASLVALALFSGFIKVIGYQGTEAHMDILDPRLTCGLLLGAMLPYWFCAMTMKSVGKAALQMVEEVRHQFDECPAILTGEVPPDYETCIRISTEASLHEMFPPACLVLFTPITIGFLFGVKTLAGVLVGSLVSGICVGVSQSNSGGAWDNAKKFISAGGLVDKDGGDYGKGSFAHKASIVGDTVGDPMKDTCGPSVNILIKLMAITSLVFGSTFPKDGLIHT